MSALAERLYRDAKADRWRLPQAAFTAALETSCAKAFRGRRRHAARGHALSGSRFIWRISRSHAHVRWVTTQPGITSCSRCAPRSTGAADALDRSGGARELADSLYADLYGVEQRDGQRQSLLRYFHGRSSLATWLRAVLAQRHVDRVRVERRTEPLPEELLAKTAPTARDPDCARFRRAACGRARDRRWRGSSARSPAPRVLLRAAVDVGANREAVERARGHDVAAARADARAHP